MRLHGAFAALHGCAQHGVPDALALRRAAAQIGAYDELSLQRFDLVLAEAANNNIKVIFPFVNFWPDLGGMQWYVDQARPLQALAEKP